MPLALCAVRALSWDAALGEWFRPEPFQRTQLLPLWETVMEDVTQFIDGLLQLVIRFGEALGARLTDFEGWAREQLSLMGISPQMQTLVLIAAAALLIAVAVRWFGGVIRLVAIVLLLLVAVHILLPMMQPT
jgi:hypothetical protein